MNYDLGNIKLIIAENYDEMSKIAGDIMAEQMRAKPDSVLGFATGSTPIGTYKRLIELNITGSIDFSRVTTFNLDEYYPIKKSNDQSYDYFMKKNLFSHINVRPGSVNLPDGEAEDIEKECARYENLIKEAGGIDMQILGIGMNGHIGFNEPADSFDKGTHHVVLDESTIQANARFFASADDVPKHAVSMGIKTIMNAEKILMVINGENKAGIVREFLFGDITPKVPASVLQLHRNVTVVLDAPAASKIKELL